MNAQIGLNDVEKVVFCQSHLGVSHGQNRHDHCKGKISELHKLLNKEHPSLAPLALLSCCSLLTPGLQGSHTLHLPKWPIAMWAPHTMD